MIENRVALVYPYFREKDPIEKLFLPLGIAYLASQLKEMDIPVTIADCTFESFDEAVEKLALLNPSIIGISIMISNSRNAFALERALRVRLPNTFILAGGPLPTLYPERFFPEFDLVFCGEGDLIMPAFCRDYLKSDDKTKFLMQIDPENYPGIFFKREKVLCSSPPIHHSQEIIRSLPLPYRKGNQNALYQYFWRKETQCRPTTIMMTRGCPYTCEFCSKPVWGSDFRTPLLDKVFEEIIEIKGLGYDQLWIADDSFTLDMNFLIAFCQEKIERNILMSWTCLSRTKGLDLKTAELMKQAGCVKVYLGLESGSDEVLALMKKNTTVQNGIDAVNLFQRAGIKTAGFFIVGYPGETWDTVQKTFDLALSLTLDEIFFNVPIPLPGSPLFSRVVGVDQQGDWEKASDVKFLYDSDFDEDALKQAIKSTMLEFENRKSQSFIEEPKT